MFCPSPHEKTYRNRQCDIRMRTSVDVEKEENVMKLGEIPIQDYARQLLDANGEKAVLVAAQKASALEQQGSKEEAETWRHVEKALKIMRGPHLS